MIALPVLAVAIADTAYSTSDVSGGEGLERRLGAAAARVELPDGAGRGPAGPDPDAGLVHLRRARDEGEPSTLDGTLAVLGRGRGPRSSCGTGRSASRPSTGVGRRRASSRSTSATRWPRAWPSSSRVGGHAAATRSWSAPSCSTAGPSGRGPHARRRERPWTSSAAPRVDASTRIPERLGPGRLLRARDGEPHATCWVAARSPGTQVRRAQRARAAGALARGRLTDPPLRRRAADEVQLVLGGLDRGAVITVLVLVVVMVLIEVVLLAGPAFAVGARRQARTLALMAAAGGSPRDARRVVLGSGVVLGLLGRGPGRRPRARRRRGPACRSSSASATARFGPFDVAWTHLLGVAVFGLVSALLAAAVPAWIASRQDVVAVLGGRRGDARGLAPAPRWSASCCWRPASPAAAYGAARGRLRAVRSYIAGLGASSAVLGMVLLVPVVVVARGPAGAAAAAAAALRGPRRRPAPHPHGPGRGRGRGDRGRCGRAGHRHHQRRGAERARPTGAALADGRRRRDRRLQPPSRLGDAGGGRPRDRSRGARCDGCRGVPRTAGARVAQVRFRAPGTSERCSRGTAVAGRHRRAGRRRRCPQSCPRARRADERRPRAALAAGGVVVFSDGRCDRDRVRVTVPVSDGKNGGRRSGPLPAVFVTVDHRYAPAQAVLSTPAADAPRHLAGGPSRCFVDGPVGAEQERGPPRGRRRRGPGCLRLRRARLPDPRRDGDRAAGAGRPRRGADAGRHPDRHLPGALRRPPRPGHPRPRSARRPAPAAAWRRRTRWWWGWSVRCWARWWVRCPGVAITYPLTAPYGFGDAVRARPATTSTCRGCWCSAWSSGCRCSPRRWSG